MKNTAQHNILLSTKPTNLHVAGLPWQTASENNIQEPRTPELKMVVVYSAKQPTETGIKPEKTKTKLYIKNMVSIRCKMVVKAVLENLGLHYVMVELGIAEIIEDISNETRNQLKADLKSFGFELMDNNNAILIERTKNAIVEMIHYADELPKTKISVYLSEKLHHDYTYLANLFSEVMGTTIEHYIIKQKIEKVKELIVYGELSIKQIIYKLNYSSVAHLSNQFKKVTGLTATFFKMMKDKKRVALENV